MKAERWSQINALFDTALDREPAERDQYLREACGDDAELLAEVQKLLASESSLTHGSFLAPAAFNVREQLPEKTDEFTNRQIGRYQLKRLLGSGGMGNVYLAVRKEDFRRRVAIKILKRGMDSDAIVKRFRREIRVLAALGAHPNIARLIDAGTTPEGTPYFVMEYVEGEEIDRYCDTQKLTVRERLDLFQTVCSAVHFAHQHTVIHRDIKPGNILVSKEGHAKLIDFGIAKLTAPELGMDTAMHPDTEFNAMTPEYASPEQVRGEAITTASDVYSLGIVLFQLLTGRRPYRLESRAPKAVENVVCEKEPQKPSTVVGVTTKITRRGELLEITPAVIGKQRKITPGILRKTLRGDLDNIVLMSLRKEPRDRYASAGQLAVELQRFLDGQPVIARRLSSMQRVMRLVRSYPAIASLIAATLIGGVFGLGYLSRLSRELVRSTELDSAAEQAHMLLSGHKYYTRVLDDIHESAPEAANQLKPPATFTIELFEFLNDSKSELGTVARVSSRYPFANRQGRPALDEFEELALDSMEERNENSFYRFEDSGDQPLLRYALAMRMEQSCCDCHNTHADSTKTDWEPGQVRGILEVARPLAGDTVRTQRGLRRAFGWIAATMLATFATVSAGIGLMHRRRV